MTQNSSQSTPSISQQFPTYGPLWQGYDLHQGVYGESQMVTPQQFQEQGPPYPGARRVLPELQGNSPINLPTSSHSQHASRHPFGTPGRLPSSLQKKHFWLSAESPNIDTPRIVVMSLWMVISSDNHDEDHVSNH
jgi:hypothetical protein